MGADGAFGIIKDHILVLKCELAFLAGRLAETLDETEKDELSALFIKKSAELQYFRTL